MPLDVWPNDDTVPTGWDVAITIRHVARRLQTRLDADLDGCALSAAQHEVLMTLRADPNLHASELARRLRVSRQSTTTLLRRLELAGLIELLPPDGGVRVPLLTPEGRRRIQLATDATRDLRDRLGHLPVDRRRGLLQVLREIDRALAPPRPRPWWLE
jgi:DNA-binding MarR family transcriptional regulator